MREPGRLRSGQHRPLHQPSGQHYWSGSEFAPNLTFAFEFNFSNGIQQNDYKTSSRYALAVSPGDVGIAAVPEPEAWGLMLSGLALVGAAARRRNTR